MHHPSENCNHGATKMLTRAGYGAAARVFGGRLLDGCPFACNQTATVAGSPARAAAVVWRAMASAAGPRACCSAACAVCTACLRGSTGAAVLAGTVASQAAA